MRIALGVLALFLLLATDAFAGGGRMTARTVVKFKAGSELSKAVNRTAPVPSSPGRSGEQVPGGVPGLSCHPCRPTDGPADPPGITINEEQKHK